MIEILINFNWFTWSDVIRTQRSLSPFSFSSVKFSMLFWWCFKVISDSGWCSLNHAKLSAMNMNFDWGYLLSLVYMSSSQPRQYSSLIGHLILTWLVILSSDWSTQTLVDRRGESLQLCRLTLSQIIFLEIIQKLFYTILSESMWSLLTQWVEEG